MTTPQVSVIIPSCNRAKLLPAAIRSVLDQTFQDFELIVVDDASGDETADVVWSFHDERIKFFRHEAQKGGAAARNTGIVNSQSDYIAFLDDDDEWFPEKLGRQVAALKESNPAVGAIYTGYDAVDISSGEVKARKIPVHKGDLSSLLLRSNCIGSTSSVLMRRKCFEDVGMFDESLPSFQDYDLWIRLSRVYQFDYVGECLLTYRLHSNKIWTNPDAIRRGIEILLEKYGASAPLRKRCSGHYLSIAVQFCEAGDTTKARVALRRAISLHPFDPRHYLYFCLSLMNQSSYRRFQASKAKVLKGLTVAASGGLRRG
jgi:glycosyltransferase involved in cell wall biosynthesis